MHQIDSDRRRAKKASFPLMDGHGKQINFERRSGKERREVSRAASVASEIINSLCLS